MISLAAAVLFLTLDIEIVAQVADCSLDRLDGQPEFVPEIFLRGICIAADVVHQVGNVVADESGARAKIVIMDDRFSQRSLDLANCFLLRRELHFFTPRGRLPARTRNNHTTGVMRDFPSWLKLQHG